MRRSFSTFVWQTFLSGVFLLLITSCTSFPSRAPHIDYLPEKVSFAGQEVPLDAADVSSRITVWYNFFLSKPWQVELWLQRGKIAFPFMEERLRASGMPLDLKYIAVAESNLNPRAISAAEAEGLWQFMERTAESFDLRIDAFIDERGDFIKSTEAAVSYLQRAREEIGSSWFLVCASFNLGIQGVQERILRQNSSNYWEMVFPPETEDYVPKIIAIKLIMENAEKFEFKVEEDWETMVKLEVETVEKPIFLIDIACPFGKRAWQIRRGEVPSGIRFD